MCTSRGSTLIELMMYIALYGILMSGVIVSVYSLLTSSGHSYTRALLSEEGLFLSAKIHRLAKDHSAHEITDILPSFASSRMMLSDIQATDTPHIISLSFSLSATTAQGNVISEQFFADVPK